MTNNIWEDQNNKNNNKNQNDGFYIFILIFLTIIIFIFEIKALQSYSNISKEELQTIIIKAYDYNENKLEIEENIIIKNNGQSIREDEVIQQKIFATVNTVTKDIIASYSTRDIIIVRTKDIEEILKNRIARELAYQNIFITNFNINKIEILSNDNQNEYQTYQKRKEEIYKNKIKEYFIEQGIDETQAESITETMHIENKNIVK